MVDIIRVGILLVGLLIISIVYLIVQAVMRKQVDKQKRSIFHKVIRTVYIVAMAMYVALVLGFDVQNVWISIASILGLVAIGFIAVWSLLGNILAAIIIFATEPFRIDSRIKLFENDIEGVVDEITFFYTVLKDDDGNFIHIANTKFFQ